MSYFTSRETDAYEDIENENNSQWDRIVFAILLVIFAGIGTYFLMQAKSYDNVSGYVLTKDFISNYCRRSQCRAQGLYSLFSAVIMLCPLVSSFTSKGKATRRTGMNLVMRVAIIVLLGVSLTGMSAFKTYIVLTNEPTVSMSTVADRYTRKSRRSSRRYYLKFSDGSRIKVSRSEYDNARIGEEYYIAYFDGTAVECFDADEYSLPG